MESIKGKVVIITGGGRGIGLGIATALAKEGANLVLTGRNEATILKSKEVLEKEYGIDVLTVSCDGAKEEQVKNVVDKTIEKFGRLDAVINNAQNSASGVMLADHTTADFDKAIFSGLYATFFYMREAFPYLKESKGSVVNFASGAGLSGLV
ncbi:MAG: SDR family oxidoreductase, partial [Clostridiales bacterium]